MNLSNRQYAMLFYAAIAAIVALSAMLGYLIATL